MNAGAASLVPLHARARAYGAFTAVFGAGSTLLGALYDHSLLVLVAVATRTQLGAAWPLSKAIALAPPARTS